MTQHYAEDLALGSTVDLGEYLVTHEEIVAFARQWDPQPFHIDDEAAASSFFGEVIASGIHTIGVFQRLAVLAVFNDWHMVAGRALRDVVFHAPVRPGMTLRAQLTIAEIDLSRPARSRVTIIGQITHDDALVLTLALDASVHRRP